MSALDDTEIHNQINNLSELGPYFARQNNSNNSIYFSDIPEICKTEPCLLGVDEAGRGPVLGPMVYGIAFCPLTQTDCLKKLGCADSKQLTEEKRDIIFNELNVEAYAKDKVGWAVEVISPNVISSNMLKRSKYSLNEVSMDSAIGLIQKAIDLGVNIAEIYVDTVGTPEKYQDKLLKIFPDFLITVAKKADSTYPIVSAASICAKVTRDHAIKVWSFPEEIDVNHEIFGCGYPGDANTKAFLQNYIDPVFGYPRLVRFSWTTATNALNGKAYNVEFDEKAADDNTKHSYNGISIASFFSKSKDQPKKPKIKHVFFRQRFLDNVSDL